MVRTARVVTREAPSTYHLRGSHAKLKEICMPKATASASTSSAAAKLDGHHLLSALRAFRKGDFSVRLPIGLSGIDGEIVDVFNDVVEQNERMTKEFERLGAVVGKEGKIGHRAKLPNATGSWASSVETVN